MEGQQEVQVSGDANQGHPTTSRHHSLVQTVQSADGGHSPLFHCASDLRMRLYHKSSADWQALPDTQLDSADLTACLFHHVGA